ncbi:neurotrypsin-like [Anneissia japonica]|uniref:neurotrypsin-like n=1 Tax=Anneissia japonica TaxID=1529436 RepID=UPI001425B662|nr:neurotrypsin-like [Anneissia japonica]
MDMTIIYSLIYCLLANLLKVPVVNTLGSIVRLRNSSSTTEGRVEVYHHGEWGTLCHENFDINTAYVVCRQLGFFSVKNTVNTRIFGAGDGPILFNDLKCTGLEENVFDCEYTNILNKDCTHNQDAGVRCISKKNTGFLGSSSSSYKPIRLVDGESPHEGRIEILHGDQWSTICDDKWDFKDARVACRQLGYTTALKSVPRARFGPGKGKILFDDTSCTGYEKYLNDCPHSEYGAHDCSHGEDAGVVCDHVAEEEIGTCQQEIREI